MTKTEDRRVPHPSQQARRTGRHRHGRIPRPWHRRPAAHASHIDLGVAGPFVVLGGESVTNTGPSILNGDLGVSTGSSLTGLRLPGVVNGVQHANDEVAANAQAASLTAFDAAGTEPLREDLTGRTSAA
jgi:hypothetical protein